jgi:hypothetical protein
LFIYEDYSPYPLKYLEQMEELSKNEGNMQEEDEHEFCPGAPYNYRHFIHMGEDYNFNSKLRWANLGH